MSVFFVVVVVVVVVVSVSDSVSKAPSISGTQLKMVSNGMPVGSAIVW